MSYDFNDTVDRRNTNSLKYDFAVERGKPADLLPLWVADMDFKTPREVLDAMQQTLSHGIFGYSEAKGDYFDAVHDWFYKYFDWDTKESWMIKTPGVVYAIAQAVKAFTKEREGVMLQQPVYYPFYEAIILNNRRLVINTLICRDNRYWIDFEDFEQKIISENVRLLILCSPHNPVGRVWTKEELTRLGDICLKHRVIVVSDEIHCDFTYPGFKHTIFASLREEFARNSIICTAPSKTFNLAGLQVSNIFIKNDELRKKFKTELDKTGYSQLNTFGLVACKAAYLHGDAWLQELKAYLYDNLGFVREYLRENIPAVKLVEPEGTYLVWLDFRSLGLTRKEMGQLIIHKAKLWLDPGHIFGSAGEGFERINIACPREVLGKALEQLKNALEAI
jgi:cystathionine beta-lyase